MPPLFGVKLVDPYGREFPTLSGRWHNGISEGIQWSCVLNGYVNGDSYSEDQQWNLHSVDQTGAAWTSPPLTLVRPRNKEGRGVGSQTTMGGIDRISYELSREGADFPTFRTPAIGDFSHPINTVNIIDLTDIITQITTNYNVTNLDTGLIQRVLTLPVTVTYPVGKGILAYHLPEYDVHGGTALQHLHELVSSVGFEYRMSNAGTLDIFPIQYSEASTVSGGLTATYERGPDLSRKVTQITMTSMRKIQLEQDFPFDSTGEKSFTLNNPMNILGASDQSTTGAVDWIIFLDAKERVCGIQTIHGGDSTTGPIPNFPPITSNSPATHGFVTVFPDPANPTVLTGLTARLRIQGRLPQTGVDAFWKLKWPAVDTNVDPRPKRTPVRSALIPSLLVARSAAPNILLVEQKGWHPATMTCEDPIFTALPAQQFQWQSARPNTRIESVDVTWAGKTISSSMQLWEAPYLA